jgi:meso-butanediol dehydrogenase / (S,S)-butanediol dehydrogenase / diacetyl reductase
MGCAIVTGAGTGIGAAAAHRLHRDGHGVVLTGRRREPLEEVARELGEALVVATPSWQARVGPRTASRRRAS